MNKILPQSIAIAGAWGYIGQKFLHAAGALGLTRYVYDPGPVPAGVDLRGVTRLDREADFYKCPAELFHLALHPEHRATGMKRLLQRGRSEPIVILCEKPMALPETPDHCRNEVEEIRRSGARVLYDFPELFDPITTRVCSFLDRYQQVVFHSFRVQRSKDREDPENRRNYKRMVPIQYQESVHCLAFVLNLLARYTTELPRVFTDGVSVTARSEVYAAPNPEIYPYAVDGRCQYEMTIGSVRVAGRTDFKRGAPWSKRRVIRGRGDGEPFEIDLDFLEGEKTLAINGREQPDVLDTDSYAEVIKTCAAWHHQVPTEALMTGLYPNAPFARTTYQLSSLLWRSSQDKRTISLPSFAALLDFDARFSAAANR